MKSDWGATGRIDSFECAVSKERQVPAVGRPRRAYGGRGVFGPPQRLRR